MSHLFLYLILSVLISFIVFLSIFFPNLTLNPFILYSGIYLLSLFLSFVVIIFISHSLSPCIFCQAFLSKLAATQREQKTK